LIVEVGHDHSIEEIFRERVFVGLSQGGIEFIKPKKIKFGLETLAHFSQILIKFGNPRLHVIGTAVLRKASNRLEFLNEAETLLKHKIEIIDGQREAELIYKGIMLLPGLRNGKHLIMDIGGGSTEFILIEDSKLIWSQSYSLGVGVLHSLFHKNEPISELELSEMAEYISKTVSEMKNLLMHHKIQYLIGASGSFEVLQNMHYKSISSENNLVEISVEDFFNSYQRILKSNYEERLKIGGLPLERAKLIVVGIYLKKLIIDWFKPEKIIVSPFALKEGVLNEMIHNLS
jgi:exopolyphosphatase/guanosine-5'-triphosphate,3'-diphosphate pyrophosphatase